MVLIGLGTAGLVVVLDHPATDAGRPELTARGDADFVHAAPTLAADVVALSTQTDAVASDGRAVMDRLRRQDTAGAHQALADGDAAVAAATTALDDLTQARDALVGELGGTRLGTANTLSLSSIGTAIAGSASLGTDWDEVTASSTPVIAVIESLGRHDALTYQATESARASDFSTALSTLTAAGTELDTARGLRDRLVQQGDVSTLSDWIDRAAAYDAALAKLYGLLQASGGVMTADATNALAAVDTAQAALPANTGALVVIVAEIGAQGYTDGLLGIDKVRGAIEGAMTALGATAEPSAQPPAAPSPSASTQ